MFRLITSLALSLLALTPIDARSDVIDLMIVWDTAAFGMGNRSIDAALIVNEANTALANSDVPHSFNLKYSHSSQALLFTAGDAQAALSFLKTHQQVRQLRDANNVDVIIMLAGNLTGTEGNTCGLAELPGRPSLSFSETLHVAVIKRSCWALSAYSVAAHELGHLVSAEHEYIRDPSPNDPVNYNHADINDQHKRRTVMASSEVACNTGATPTALCTPAALFFTPARTYPNLTPAVPAGGSLANNARMISESGRVVSKYRPLPAQVTLLAPTCALEFVGCSNGKRRYLVSWYPNDSPPFPVADADYSVNGGSIWYDLYGGLDACTPIVPSTPWIVRARVRSAWGDSACCTIQIQSGSCSGGDL